MEYIFHRLHLAPSVSRHLQYSVHSHCFLSLPKVSILSLVSSPDAFDKLCRGQSCFDGPGNVTWDDISYHNRVRKTDGTQHSAWHRLKERNKVSHQSSVPHNMKCCGVLCNWDCCISSTLQAMLSALLYSESSRGGMGDIFPSNTLLCHWEFGSRAGSGCNSVAALKKDA